MLNKLKFFITMCLRPISLYQKILQRTLSILIEQLFEKLNVGANCFYHQDEFSKYFCFVVLKILTLPILFVCLRPIFPCCFIKLFFKVIVVSVGTILKFTSMLMCLRLIFLCFHQADLKRVVAPLN